MTSKERQKIQKRLIKEMKDGKKYPVLLAKYRLLLKAFNKMAKEK